MYYEVTIEIVKASEEKKKKEVYLFEAISVTEAESRAIKELSPFCPAIEVLSSKKLKMARPILHKDGNYFYSCVIMTITTTEKGDVKEVPENYIVNADTLIDAVERVCLEFTEYTPTIKSVKETKIVDIYPLESEEVEDES